MKMNKRLLSMILVVVMVLGMIPLNAIATDETDPIQVTHLDTCVEGCTGEDCACACHQVMIIDEDPTVACTLCDGIFAEDGETVIHNPTCLTKCSCTPVDGVHVAPCVLATAAQEDEGGEEDPLCDKCNAVKNEDGTLTHEATCEFAQSEEPLCNMCEATKDENGDTVHADGCKGPCKCEAVIEGYHSNMECPYHVEPADPADPVCTGNPETCLIENCECKQPKEPSFYEKVMAVTTLADMKLLMDAEENQSALNSLTNDEVLDIAEHLEAVYAETNEEDLEVELMTLLMTKFPVAFGMPGSLVEGKVLTNAGGALAPGKYYLNENLNLKNRLDISGAVEIDLNGYVLQGKGSDYVIKVSGSGAKLIIKDSQPDLGHIGNLNATTGLWEWKEGNLAQFSKGGIITNRGTGKGISVSGNGIVEMQAGMIAGCYASDIGAAVTADSSGTFIMTGGRIIGNVTKSEDNGNNGSRAGAIYGEPSHNNNGSRIDLSNATIMYNTSVGNGGAICGYNVTLNNCDFEDNKTTYHGGAVYVRRTADSSNDAVLNITNCTFKNNTAGAYGGAVMADNNSRITVSGDTEFTYNKAAYGGALFGDKVDITGTSAEKILFEYNVATTSGGAIYAKQYADIDHVLITYNRAGTFGGGIYSAGELDIDNSDLTNNDAIPILSDEQLNSKIDGLTLAGRGGAVCVVGIANFDNVNLVYNRSLRYGGAIQIHDKNAKVYFNSGSISYNQSIVSGAGGVHVTDDSYFELVGGEMIGNTCSTVGGAIHSSYQATVKISGGIIKENKVTSGRGGAIHVDVGVNLEIAGSTIENNEAITANKVGTVVISGNQPGATVTVERDGAYTEGYGGGIAVDSGTFTMSDGTISNNYAQGGGGGVALVMIIMGSDSRATENKVVEFGMTGGTISNNRTDGSGGGLYLMKNNLGTIVDAALGSTTIKWTDAEKATLNALKTSIPKLEISGGTITNNTAKVSGGGAYQEENTRFIISGTGDISNNTAIDGAGVYIAKGTAEINGGTIQSNTASGVGGGLYVLGNVTMTDGVVQNNTAVGDGGALYITSDTTNDVIGNFIMTSGKLLNNKAGNGENLSNGGGAYVFGGNITIGVPACEGDTTEGTRPNHTVEPMNKIHPLIQGNTATDSGGGLALIGSGNITMYCGNITNNDATNRGRGLNVYMEEGKFDYHNGDVGALESPELVIVGGTLVNNKLLENGDITLKYYHCNDTVEHTGDLEDKTATATKLSKFNLPDGEKYWKAPKDYRFFGWTFYGPNDEDAPDHVRNKDHYKPMGEPIVAQDVYDGIEDNTIEMYALWAPETSYITYVGNVINGTFTNEALSATNQATYSFSISDYNIVLNSPVKSGYTFLGWYYYQNENQNANWGNEPQYKEGTTDRTYANLDYSKVKSSTVPDGMGFLSVETSGSNKGKCILPVEATNFGDITLIAKFKPAFTTLTITKSGANEIADPNQSFVFNISGEPYDDAIADIDMDIIITGNGTKTIEYLPVGDYTVKEITDWSWRYAPGNKTVSIAATNPDYTYNASFSNTRDENKWLDGDNVKRNWFNVE